MRKGNVTILASVFMMAMVALGVGAGTMAYFSDVEKSTGNTFTAGTIDIQVNGENPWTSHFEMLDVKPCETKWITITIINVGGNELEVWKHIYDVSCSGGEHPESENDEDPTDTDNEISGVIRYDLKIDSVDKIVEADDYTITDGNHHLAGDTDGVACYWIYLGTIAKAGSMTVEQSYHMDEDTTNWAQGDTMTFTIEFLAQQTANSPPPPTPELPGYGKP